MAFDPANRGGASGSSYGFSNYRSNPSIQGNWNTGGTPTGFGSLAGGISPYGGVPQIGGPRNGNAPRVAPAVAPAVPQVPIPRSPPWDKVNLGKITDVFGPPVRMDPGIIAQMLKSMNQPQSPMPAAGPGSTQYKQPARGSFMGNGYGGDMYGRTYGGPRNSNGFSGGGMGGGGGGGW